MYTAPIECWNTALCWKHYSGWQCIIPANDECLCLDDDARHTGDNYYYTSDHGEGNDGCFTGSRSLGYGGDWRILEIVALVILAVRALAGLVGISCCFNSGEC